MKKALFISFVIMSMMSRAMADDSRELVLNKTVKLELHPKVCYLISGTNLGFVEETSKGAIYLLIYLNNDGIARAVHRDQASGGYYINVSGPDSRKILDVQASVAKNILSRGMADSNVRHGRVTMQKSELEQLEKKKLVQGLPQRGS